MTDNPKPLFIDSPAGVAVGTTWTACQFTYGPLAGVRVVRHNEYDGVTSLPSTVWYWDDAGDCHRYQQVGIENYHYVGLTDADEKMRRAMGHHALGSDDD